MQGLSCHKSRRVLELFIQARQEIIKHNEGMEFDLFMNSSRINTTVRDLGLAILFDSDTVASNFTDDLSKLSDMYKGLFYPVKTLLHQVAVNDDTEAYIFEVYVGDSKSVFVGSIYDVIELARRLNLRNGDDLALSASEASQIMGDSEFGFDADYVLMTALQDPVTGVKSAGILSKSANAPKGPSSGTKGVYRAVSRLEGYAPCYYKVSNVRGVITLSILDKKRSGKYKWSKVGYFVDGVLRVDMLDGHARDYNLVMLDPIKTSYTHNSTIPPLGDINHYMGNRNKQHRKRRYIAM